jgi:hypothetical protein
MRALLVVGLPPHIMIGVQLLQRTIDSLEILWRNATRWTSFNMVL